MDKIKKRREIKEEINQSQSEEEKRIAREKYSEAHREAKDSVRRDKQTYLEDMAEKAEQAAANGHMKIVYQVTKTIAGKYGKPSILVRDKQGHPIFDPN